MLKHIVGSAAQDELSVHKKNTFGFIPSQWCRLLSPLSITDRTDKGLLNFISHLETAKQSNNKNITAVHN